MEWEEGGGRKRGWRWNGSKEVEGEGGGGKGRVEVGRVGVKQEDGEDGGRTNSTNQIGVLGDAPYTGLPHV